jgi:hypothetical protein
MGWAQNEHPPDDLPAFDESGVGARRDGAGIDVAGVGHNHGLWRIHKFRRHGCRQEAGNLGMKAVGIRRIKTSGDRGQALGGVSHDLLQSLG